LYNVLKKEIIINKKKTYWKYKFIMWVAGKFTKIISIVDKQNKIKILIIYYHKTYEQINKEDKNHGIFCRPQFKVNLFIKNY
jgi:hypothetical protein